MGESNELQHGTHCVKWTFSFGFRALNESQRQFKEHTMPEELNKRKVFFGVQKYLDIFIITLNVFNTSMGLALYFFHSPSSLRNVPSIRLWKIPFLSKSSSLTFYQATLVERCSQAFHYGKLTLSFVTHRTNMASTILRYAFWVDTYKTFFPADAWKYFMKIFHALCSSTVFRFRGWQWTGY